jgi:hypothetical protein
LRKKCEIGKNNQKGLKGYNIQKKIDGNKWI